MVENHAVGEPPDGLRPSEWLRGAGCAYPGLGTIELLCRTQPRVVYFPWFADLRKAPVYRSGCQRVLEHILSSPIHCVKSQADSP